jgi:hypothetical protein
MWGASLVRDAAYPLLTIEIGMAGLAIGASLVREAKETNQSPRISLCLGHPPSDSIDFAQLEMAISFKYL